MKTIDRHYPKNHVRHLPAKNVTLSSLLKKKKVYLFSRHKGRDYKDHNAFRRYDHDTSSTLGTASSEAFYLITLGRGWAMFWLAF